MGREIRRVPAGWEHPKEPCKHSPWAGGCEEALAGDGSCYRPLLGDDYEARAEAWVADCVAWAQGTHKDQQEQGKDELPRFFWEWDGGPPQREDYVPRFESEPTHYQIYETVSEGTPVSPVFASLDELSSWLIGEGYTPEAAARFAQGGWAPSMLLVRGGPNQGLYQDIHALTIPTEER